MKINGGTNFDPVYGSSNAVSEDTGRFGSTGRSENKPNSIDWINGYNPGRDRDSDDYRKRDHRGHERGPIGDPQVAAEIRHLLQELEGVLRCGQGSSDSYRFRVHHREPIDADRISFGNWGKPPMDADRISFRHKTPLDADKISFGVEE